MKPFPIPVVALGPGSQPVDEPPRYIAAPGAMAVFRPPSPRPAASAQALAGARALLGRLLSMLEDSSPGRATPRLSLLEAEPGVATAFNELLGYGEVSALISAPRPTRVQECAFPGIWRVRSLRDDGELATDYGEAGPVPQVIHAALARLEVPAFATPGAEANVMNAPAILNELRAASGAHTPGAEPYIVNLTLLPMTPEDLDYLATGLGGGPVTILSRGYGNCRVTSTALPHTWWVQFFNRSDQLILNTLEVTDVPAVAVAAAEDLADSIGRLREWLATL
jgi:hydrogenase-1 operon protein HyaF